MSIDFATHFIDMIGQWCNNSDIMIASGGKLSIINLSNTNTMFIVYATKYGNGNVEKL